MPKVGALAAAADVSAHRILLIEAPKTSDVAPKYPTMKTLMTGVEGAYTYFPERTFGPGEGKTTTAFYYFSCGLTGLLKVRMCPFMSPLLLMLHLAFSNKPLRGHRKHHPARCPFPDH